MAHLNARLPFELDARDPSFPRECILWARQTQREMEETIEATKETIDKSKELITEVDRILARG